MKIKLHKETKMSATEWNLMVALKVSKDYNAKCLDTEGEVFKTDRGER